MSSLIHTQGQKIPFNHPVFAEARAAVLRDMYKGDLIEKTGWQCRQCLLDKKEGTQLAPGLFLPAEAQRMVVCDQMLG